ncbi:MAG: class I SAM-dependent methyltransferase [Chlamydiota bacterium]|jgi:SAM-dependent methyltransferase
MGNEIDLLINYPKTKRNVKERGATKTEEDRLIARQFGKDFFDGDRRHGYGGYHYNARFWQPVVPTFQKYYNLSSESKILDVGCGKGFMLYDFMQIIPGVQVSGIDVSEYAINNAKEEVKPYLQVADAMELPFEDNSFDLVISINTVHNLAQNDLMIALKEIERVSKNHSYITIDAYRDMEEKELMFHWNLTAKTILHVEEWKTLFKNCGYTGDYYWFIP